MAARTRRDRPLSIARVRAADTPATVAAALLSVLLTGIAAIAGRDLRAAPVIAPLILFALAPTAAIALGRLWVAVAAAVAAAMICGLGPYRLSPGEVALFDGLIITTAASLRVARNWARDFDALQAIIRAVLDIEPSGILVLSRNGRTLHASREAERICGPDIRASGVGPQSPVRLATASGQPLGALDLIIGVDQAHASNGSSAPAQELLVTRADGRQTWIGYRSTVVRFGRSAAAVAIAFWPERARRAAGDVDPDEAQRKRREEREEMLHRISQHLRGSLDPNHIHAVAVAELGSALRADRCFFLLFNVNGCRAVMGPQWCGPNVSQQVKAFDTLDIDVERLYLRGVTRVSHDIRSSSLPTSFVNLFENTLGVRSTINVPLYDGDGTPSGALIVGMAHQQRAWSVDEVAIAEMVAGQTRFVIEAARLLAAERGRAQREELANEIGNAIRSSLDPAAIQREATHALGRALDVDRCWYMSCDSEAGVISIGPDYVRHHMGPSLTGTYDLCGADDTVSRLLRASDPLIVADSDDCPLSAASALLPPGEGARAFLRIPVTSGGNATAALSVAMADEPRPWRDDEIALAQSVAQQTHAALNMATSIVEERSRAERQELLSRVTLAIGDAKSVREAQREATSLLGRHLAADRCYFIEMDYYRGLASVASEFARQDLEPVVGNYASESPEMRWLVELVSAGRPEQVPDVQKRLADTPFLGRGAATLLRARHRSLLTVPHVVGGRLDSVLVLASAERPREWTRREVELAEEVSIRMRAALQTAATHEREHRIAVILQGALLPDVPRELPGLHVATSYRAALVEASIGGDFYDGFDLSPTRAVICVGDVSGKGLKAAAQLSTLRNMLRVLLYREAASVESAIAELNGMLAQHKLMSDFATLFAGIYDATTRRLTYVSCGQEPAILLRGVGGSPRVLASTAPAIGLFEADCFEQGSVTLAKGDLLLVYTDGVPEAGMGGRGMLGTNGVARLFAESAQTAKSDPHRTMAEIVDRVERHADGQFHDDICLLLARAL